MTGTAGAGPKSDSFRLQGASDFSARMDDIFGSLNHLEAKHQAWEHSSHSDNEKLIKSDPDLPELNPQKRRGEFKVPSARWIPPNRRNPGKRNITPDYQIHPEKWTKYSLESVSDADMSEASNTAAALEFLEQRRRQQPEETVLNDDVVVDQPVIFQRRRLHSSDDYEESDNSEASSTSVVAQSGKLIMPECVVGAKITTKKLKKDAPCRPKADAVKLDYLHDDDEEEGNNESTEALENADLKSAACTVPKKKARYDDDVVDDDAQVAKEELTVSATASFQKRRIRSLRVAHDDDD